MFTLTRCLDYEGEAEDAEEPTVECVEVQEAPADDLPGTQQPLASWASLGPLTVVGSGLGPRSHLRPSGWLPHVPGQVVGRVAGKRASPVPRQTGVGLAESKPQLMAFRVVGGRSLRAHGQAGREAAATLCRLVGPPPWEGPMDGTRFCRVGGRPVAKGPGPRYRCPRRSRGRGWPKPRARPLFSTTEAFAWRGGMVHPTGSAAPSCTPAGTGPLPTVTYSSDSTSAIYCDELTGGLTLTVEKGVTIGTKASLLTKAGIEADGKDIHESARAGVDGDDVSDTDSAGDNDVTITNSGTIYGTTRGITGVREWTGKQRIEHKAGKIVLTGSLARGINAYHAGKANSKTKGIEIVSAAAINLSGATSENFGIFARTRSARAGTTVPIMIDVTGGTIKIGGSGTSAGIYVKQYVKGEVAVTAASGVKSLSSGEGILVDRRETEGDVAITAAKGSMIQTQNNGIFVREWVSGDMTITNSCRINARTDGIVVAHNIATVTGTITITATKDSVISSEKRGLTLLSAAKGAVTIANGGRIDAVGFGGAFSWTDGLTLSGQGFYATAGFGNTDFGGSLTLRS